MTAVDHGRPHPEAAQLRELAVLLAGARDLDGDYVYWTADPLPTATA